MAADTQPEITTCAICGESADVRLTAECNWCDRRYHLNQRNDVEAKDCGEVWIDEQFLALQFACNDCLRTDAAGRDEAPKSARQQIGPVRRRYRKRG